MGRPPKQTQSRNKSLNIRLTDAELNMINGCAQRLGISRTDAIIKGIELIEQKNKTQPPWKVTVSYRSENNVLYEILYHECIVPLKTKELKS